MAEKINYKTRPTKKYQKIWNYIRRNNNFKYSDLEIVIDMGKEYLGIYLNALLKAEYLVLTKKSGYKIEREYRLIKHTGTLAPQHCPKEKKLYDQNMKSYVYFSKDRKDISNVYKMVSFMLEYLLLNNKKTITRNELINIINPKQHYTALEWVNKLEKSSVITKKKANNSYKNAMRWERNFIKEDGVFIYEVDLKITKKLYGHIINREGLLLLEYWKK